MRSENERTGFDKAIAACAGLVGVALIAGGVALWVFGVPTPRESGVITTRSVRLGASETKTITQKYVNPSGVPRDRVVTLVALGIGVLLIGLVAVPGLGVRVETPAGTFEVRSAELAAKTAEAVYGAPAGAGYSVLEGAVAEAFNEANRRAAVGKRGEERPIDDAEIDEIAQRAALVATGGQRPDS